MIAWLVLIVGNQTVIRGVCSSRALAMQRCSLPNDVIGPVEVDAQFPPGIQRWKGAFAPLLPLSPAVAALKWVLLAAILLVIFGVGQKVDTDHAG